MTADKGGQPAGWYPDHAMQVLRYWDGARWTQDSLPMPESPRPPVDARELPVAAMLAPVATAGASSEVRDERANRWSGRRVQIIRAVIAVAVLGAVVFAVLPSSKREPRATGWQSDFSASEFSSLSDTFIETFDRIEAEAPIFFNYGGFSIAEILVGYMCHDLKDGRTPEAAATDVAGSAQHMTVADGMKLYYIVTDTGYCQDE